jgi:hypothetical protein
VKLPTWSGRVNECSHTRLIGLGLDVINELDKRTRWEDEIAVLVLCPCWGPFPASGIDIHQMNKCNVSTTGRSVPRVLDAFYLVANSFRPPSNKQIIVCKITWFRVSKARPHIKTFPFVPYCTNFDSTSTVNAMGGQPNLRSWDSTLFGCSIHSNSPEELGCWVVRHIDPLH